MPSLAEFLSEQNATRHLNISHSFLDFYCTLRLNKQHLSVNIMSLVEFGVDSRKAHAKARLVKNFQPELDYVVIRHTAVGHGAASSPRVSEVNEPLIEQTVDVSYGNARRETILMTPDAFKGMCLLSCSAKGKHIRKAFVELEDIYSLYIETVMRHNPRYRQLHTEADGLLNLIATHKGQQYECVVIRKESVDTLQFGTSNPCRE